MKTLSERLAFCFERAKVKKVRLAEYLGVNPASITDWEKGRSRTPSAVNLLKMAEFFKVDPTWLATGEGDPMPKENSLIVVGNDDNEDFQQIKQEFWEIENVKKPFNYVNGLIEIDPSVTIKNVSILRVYARKVLGIDDPTSIRLMSGQGTTMTPLISPDDICFIDISCKHVNQSGIYIIKSNDLLIFKRIIVLTRGNYQIMSDNQAEYPDKEILTTEEFRDIEIFGKYLACWKIKR